MRRRGRGRGIRRKKGRERRERGKKVDGCIRIDPKIPGREGCWSRIALKDVTDSMSLEQAFWAARGTDVAKRDLVVVKEATADGSKLRESGSL